MKNLKKLMERREELKQQLAALVDAADQEERAMTEEETRAFDAAEKEIQDIDETLAREERARNIPTVQQPTEQHEMTVEERAAAEEKAFADFITLRYVQFFAEFLNGFAFFIAPDRFDFELSWVFYWHSLISFLKEKILSMQ